MNEKKVIAVIVEGPSDEAAIGGILREYFSSDEVQFAVVYGDITSDDNTTVDNVVSKVDQIIDRLRSKYGYHWDDFLKIIHIADTDGVFTKNCVVRAETESILFAEKYEGKASEFINYISEGSLAVPGTYKETWQFIEMDKHSLERHSNMHLIFST